MAADMTHAAHPALQLTLTPQLTSAISCPYLDANCSDDDDAGYIVMHPYLNPSQCGLAKMHCLIDSSRLQKVYMSSPEPCTSWQLGL